MAQGYTRSVRFYRCDIRLVLRVWHSDIWRFSVTFAGRYEIKSIEMSTFDDPISAVNSLGAYVDELIDGARLITRIRVQRAMEKLTRDVLKGEAQ